MVEELSGEELVLVLLAVSEAVVVLVKIRLPGTVRGLFTAPNTGAGLGCTKREWCSVRVVGCSGQASIYHSSLC